MKDWQAAKKIDQPSIMSKSNFMETKMSHAACYNQCSKPFFSHTGYIQKKGEAEIHKIKVDLQKRTEIKQQLQKQQSNSTKRKSNPTKI